MEADTHHLFRKPLHLAAQNNDTGAIRSLLDGGADIEGIEKGKTPLIVACLHNNLEAVQILLTRGANIEAIDDRHGHTSLSIAGNAGLFEMVSLLIEYGADIFAPCDRVYSIFDSCIQPPLYFAIQQYPLHLAARNNDGGSISSLLDEGFDIEAVNYQKTPLIVACLHNNLEAARVLLDRGANIEALDEYGCTPLLIAGNAGFFEMVLLLIDRDADIFVSSDRGYSLFDSDIYVRPEILELLRTVRATRQVQAMSSPPLFLLPSPPSYPLLP